MNFKKRACGVLISAGTTLAMVTALGAGVAHADPPSGTFREIALTGSDTTTPIMQALAEDAAALALGGTKKVASYGALPQPSTIVTQSGCTPINRPNGSGQGRTALINSLVAGNGCLQGARTSVLNLATTGAGVPKLVYVPFAHESVTYAISNTSNFSKFLTTTDLQGYYQCTKPNFFAGPYKVMLPQASSGTGSFWISKMYPGGTLPSPAPACAQVGTDENGASIEEHNGTQVNNFEIAPFSVAQWVGQTVGGLIADTRGPTRLGMVDGKNPFNNDFPTNLQRDLYNVFPEANITGTDQISQDVRALFMDTDPSPSVNTAQICTGAAALGLIKTYFLSSPATCGDISQITA